MLSMAIITMFGFDGCVNCLYPLRLRQEAHAATCARRLIGTQDHLDADMSIRCGSDRSHPAVQEVHHPARHGANARALPRVVREVEYLPIGGTGAEDLERRGF